VSESLGDLYDPLGSHLDDPYPFYAQARRAERIFFSPALNAWVVTRLADVQKVLRDGDTYSSANALRPFSPLSPQVFAELAKGYPPGPRYITMDGATHRRLRGPSAAGFSPERVAAAEPYITERANDLIDAFAKAGRADFHGHGAHYCLGAGLARRQIEISLRVLTARLPDLRLAPDQQISFRPSLSHRGPLSLQLEW
jgi:cytochrome P450